MVGLRGVREGRVSDGEEDGREEEHAAAEHLGGGEICAMGGGHERAAGVSQSRTSMSYLIRQRERERESVWSKFCIQALVKWCTVFENVRIR